MKSPKRSSKPDLEVFLPKGTVAAIKKTCKLLGGTPELFIHQACSDLLGRTAFQLGLNPQAVIDDLVVRLPDKDTRARLFRLCKTTGTVPSRLAGVIVACGLKAMEHAKPGETWEPDPAEFKSLYASFGFPNGQGALSITWPGSTYRRLSAKAKEQATTINQVITRAVKTYTAGAPRKGQVAA